jgi:uncharacterized protein
MRDALEDVLSSLGEVSIAVSGGVDSVTLATIANRLNGPDRVAIVHAVSPAVPPEATERVQALAASEGWDLRIIDAGEFADADYLKNPLNRCFFCKGHLYGAIAALSKMDDLGEYRPGLDAAKGFSVRHPFVEAGIDKKGVRERARLAGLGLIAELPASPCLSSRIETSIAIKQDVLAAVHRIESFLTKTLDPKTVRCRVRRSGIVVELDPDALSRAGTLAANGDALRDLLPDAYKDQPLSFEQYRNGSAFVGARP